MKFDSNELPGITAPVDVDFMLASAAIKRWLLIPIVPPIKVLTEVMPPPLTLNDLGLNNFPPPPPEDDPFFLGYTAANQVFQTNPPAWENKRVYHKSFISGNHVFVQYWFFYPTSFLPFGPMVGSLFWHEGDWEMFQFTVRLRDADDPTTEDVDESTKPYWMAPFAVTASQHFYGQTLKWKQEDGDNPPASPNQDYIEKSGAFQPKVYVAAKSHATYLRAGEFETPISTDTSNAGWAYMFPPGYPTDRARGGGSTFVPTSAQLSTLHPPILNNWLGLWGRIPGILDQGGNGPPSPSLRGPAEAGGVILIQSDPTGFHNSYLKSTQQHIAIP